MNKKISLLVISLFFLTSLLLFFSAQDDVYKYISAGLFFAAGLLIGIAFLLNRRN